jgi:hypothetical protein
VENITSTKTEIKLIFKINIQRKKINCPENIILDSFFIP